MDGRVPRGTSGTSLLVSVLGILLAVIVAACSTAASPTTSATSSTPVTSGGTPTPASSPHESPPVAPPPKPTRTPSPSPTPPPVILVGAGDIAECGSDGDEATAALLEAILEADPGTVFTAGDNVYERGTAAEFADCYAPTWGRFRDRTLPAPGNHDYETAGATAYFEYFGAAAGTPGAGWYAVDVGTWRVYVLNSECAQVGGCDAGSPQERWLRQALADDAATCSLAIWHRPRFSSGPHGSDPATDALWRDLVAAGTELVIAGHDHLYERFAPKAADGTPDPAGTVAFVVGTGGRRLYDMERVAADSLVRETDTLGVLRLALDPTGYTFDFVPVAGGTFTDHGGAACH